jgi:hypothetical protein
MNCSKFSASFRGCDGITHNAKHLRLARQHVFVRRESVFALGLFIFIKKGLSNMGSGCSPTY